MTSRMIITQNGERTEQELNELASLIVNHIERTRFEKSTEASSKWAEGYNQALNTIEAIINGLPANLVAS